MITHRAAVEVRGCAATPVANVALGLAIRPSKTWRREAEQHRDRPLQASARNLRHSHETCVDEASTRLYDAPIL